MNPFSINTILVGAIMSFFLFAVLAIILMTTVAVMNSVLVIVPALLINIIALIYIAVKIL